MAADGRRACCTCLQAKLSQVAGIPEDRLLFRGVGGMRLPECFYEPDETGVMGGADPAFLSATTDRNVAVHYIAGRDMATILSIAVSAVSRGACLSHISQFPEEEEVRCSRQRQPWNLHCRDMSLLRAFVCRCFYRAPPTSSNVFPSI